MTIGQRIKNIRQFRGMTQMQLGIRMGFEKNSADIRIAQYETGKRVPKQKYMRLLAEVLGVSMEALSPTIAHTPEDLMQTILWWDSMKGGGDIYDCIKTWETMKNKRDSGEITDEEYFIWHITHSSLPTA